MLDISDRSYTMAVMMNKKGTEMSKPVSVSLTAKQIDVLRGVLYEYYLTHDYHDREELDIHQELENILGIAEDEIYQSN